MGLFTRQAIPAGMTILPLAIEAASRANGDVKLDIYRFAVHINHCWHGNTYARSDVADLTVDGGLGAYYRFSVVASVDIPAGAELLTDYRLAPWFVQQAHASWGCRDAERGDLGPVEVALFHALPWEADGR
jgi:hypothetical protein